MLLLAVCFPNIAAIKCSHPGWYLSRNDSSGTNGTYTRTLPSFLKSSVAQTIAFYPDTDDGGAMAEEECVYVASIINNEMMKRRKFRDTWDDFATCHVSTPFNSDLNNDTVPIWSIQVGGADPQALITAGLQAVSRSTPKSFFFFSMRGATV